ncbi:MAG: hypothetical protein ACRDXX_15195 [Stackebrandtia sp.]
MSTSATPIRPDATSVGKRAAAILADIENDIEFDRLVSSTERYIDCWATFTGYPLIAQWSESTDKAPLFQEGLRVLALKAAVWEATNGDEEAAELLVSPPVDEMVHAILAQTNLLTRLTTRLNFPAVHMTDMEEFGWEPGDYTEQCYRAAGWGEPPSRYWIGTTEAKRRLDYLNDQLAKAGFAPFGKSHRHDFAELASTS